MPGYELIGAEELKEINDIFSSGGGVLFRHGFDSLRNNCFKVKDFENNFAKKLNSSHALAVSSGTAALRVALASLGIGPGDEVITQSFTFVATVEAIIESGATPVIADIDETLNLSAKSLDKLITKKTKAVICVHMLGVPSDLNNIIKVCNQRNIRIIEDVAWGCGGNIYGKKLGTFGDVGCFSFDYAKTITTGEGGMLIFNTKSLYLKASAWHDHGHENNPTVPRWEDTRTSSGFNYRMSELQAAVGIAQLLKIEKIIKLQRTNRDLIWNEIKDLPGIFERKMPSGSFDTADALVFLTNSKSTALSFRQSLFEEGIYTKILPEAISWHYAGEWTHMKSLVERNSKNGSLTFPESEKILSRAVSIPINLKMNDAFPRKIARILRNKINETTSHC